MVAYYGGISVISPWLASLAAFMCVSPSSLTSTASLERSWVRWLICVCESVLCASHVGPWTHNCLRVCVCVWVRVGEIISVFTDLCQSWRSVEFLWRDTLPTHILHSPVNCHEGVNVRQVDSSFERAAKGKLIQTAQINCFYTILIQKRSMCNLMFKVRFKNKNKHLFTHVINYISIIYFFNHVSMFSVVFSCYKLKHTWQFLPTIL